MGSNLSRDSAIEQFVFFCVKLSVAAVKMDNSWGFALVTDAPDVASLPGEGGMVGCLSLPMAWCSQMDKKLSNPLTFGRSHWYVIGWGCVEDEARRLWSI